MTDNSTFIIGKYSSYLDKNYAKATINNSDFYYELLKGTTCPCLRLQDSTVQQLKKKLSFYMLIVYLSWKNVSI